MTLKQGDTAPDFALMADTGETLSKADYAGKPLVLYFYPRASTPGCTTQACDFTAALPDFEKLGCDVIGVSKDGVKKINNFRNKQELKIKLASDMGTTACEDYGVWREKQMYGKTYMGIERTTFLIAADGTIARIWPKVKVKGHADEVLQAVQAL